MKNMKNMKKIIIIFIVVAIALGAHLLFREKSSIEDDQIIEDFSFDLLGIDLRFSELDSVELPRIELNTGLEFEGLGINLEDTDTIESVSPNVSFDTSIFNISFPQVNTSIPQMPTSPSPGSGTPPSPGPDEEGTSPSTWQPNSSDCSLFATAPNCSYVPEQNRDMCEQCKTAGF